MNVASRVLTMKNAQTPDDNVFVDNIIGTNLLTKFHDDRTINVASRAKCPPPGGHIFQATVTIFELVQDIMGANLLTKFHDDQTINMTSRVLTRPMLTPQDAQRTKSHHQSSP
ncbi:hypothetical protein DPMN_164672 [Dreissena polymorpha]|uniref:Uncharacterized protein n=1 Tax=Dreissena polymorpha TaxID=45954 RepID=A0A9D4EU19_DREPO|nr:hypothetical protein DPMN_164672 [Dreissena polymorpha]